MSDVNNQLLNAAKALVSALNDAMPHMDTGHDGVGPDCTKQFQALIDGSQAIAAAEQEQQADIGKAISQQAEPVARVVKYANGEKSISWSDKALRDIPHGALLYAKPPAVAVAVPPALPDWMECDAKVQADTANAMERFIYANEPAGDDAAEFRAGLLAVLAAAPQAAVPAQAAAIPDELTCEDIERLRLALSWEGYSTPESLEACAARWPSLVRDLIAGVLDRKKRTQAAAQKGGA